MDSKTAQNKKVDAKRKAKNYKTMTKNSTIKKSSDTKKTGTARKTPSAKKKNNSNNRIKHNNSIAKVNEAIEDNLNIIKSKTDVSKFNKALDENINIIKSRTTIAPIVKNDKNTVHKSKNVIIKKKSKQKENIKYIILSIIALILLIALYSLLFKKTNKSTILSKDVYFSEETVVDIQEYNLSLVMVGDNLIHGAIYDDARDKSTGTYNFYKIIENYKPIISKYDLAFYNQESLLGGTALGLSSYPRFNSPQEVGDAFIDAGFNLVSLANNHSLDKGEKGILSSLEYWKNKKGIMTAGSYSSFEDRDKDVIMEKNGITYALLSYTTTTNGLNVPKGKEYLVNVYSDEQAKKDVERLRGKVDLLLVAMHWGEEYTHNPTEEQERIANYLACLNVDIIIGHHPHVIQPVDFIGKTMVIYSLGNFVASQYGPEKLTGLVMSVNVHKKVENGKVEVTINNPTASLSYMYSEKTNYRHSYKLYPYDMLNDDILKDYKIYYSKFMNIVTSRNKKILYNSL